MQKMSKHANAPEKTQAAQTSRDASEQTRKQTRKQVLQPDNKHADKESHAHARRQAEHQTSVQDNMQSDTSKQGSKVAQSVEGAATCRAKLSNAWSRPQKPKIGNRARVRAQETRTETRSMHARQTSKQALQPDTRADDRRARTQADTHK